MLQDQIQLVKHLLVISLWMLLKQLDIISELNGLELHLKRKWLNTGLKDLREEFQLKEKLFSGIEEQLEILFMEIHQQIELNICAKNSIALNLGLKKTVF